MAQHLQAAGFPFIQQYEFHETRKWKADFLIMPKHYSKVPAWRVERMDAGLLLEVEGIHYRGAGGRHQRGAGYEEDCRKYNEAAVSGWRLLRVTPAMVKKGEALRFVERMFETGGPSHA